MGSLCLTGCGQHQVVDESGSAGVIFLRNRVEMSRNILGGDYGKCIYSRVRRYNQFFAPVGQRAVSRSFPLMKSNEEESSQEEYFDTFRTIRSDYISYKLQSVRHKKVHSSERLEPLVELRRNPSIRSRSQIFSDWADDFESDSLNFSNLSEVPSDDTMFLESPGLQDNDISSPASVFNSTITLSVESGMVLAMYLTNDGHRFKQLNLDMSLQDVLATFLSIDNKIKLPMSITDSKKSHPMILGRRQMLKNIAENIGPNFDAKTQGLIFSTGPVNSILCYKICFGDLDQMQKILSLHAKYPDK